ncbi:MAG: Brp/Blh family beta-carotene 15,15'-dioxygenase [Bacteroidia bacterium]|nr:Brp/Blh family beta-carotene 15,15'-dioxygenase [Bacteroidia bacterium]NNF31964.1 beta-carotene 15,15'-dioxygenase, Brp/Blh family [Flavobacteriaceae bacterium]MBT8275370.1 Brp/Blh family beta-carotene 15,15'-dioxygenase [Bacteroidia bacterium]NNJ83054.1 beta-carotene 15,15'-dioxygenase, Brp/Blh family [Flavobacteriaceae bacterium]NNK54334.1 beta-carotene 15,15'-dioxygenase, Brp/Blh family [Flavobacteriaceae bacterium]
MNFNKIAIFVTLFSLWLTNYFSGSGQEIVAFSLIFSVGILHGSNDLAIMNKLQSVSGIRKIATILGSYILIVVIAGGLFYLLPKLALAGFILFSAYHFGEQHWEDTISKASVRLIKLSYLSYGMLILCLLFYMNTAETQDIITALTGQLIPQTWFLYGLVTAGVVFVFSMLYFLLKKYIEYSRLLFEAFLLLVLSIVFKYADLIWAFAIYFIYWHSIPSIFGQLKYLYGDVSFGSFKRYLKSSSLIWVISVSSMLLLFYLFRDNEEVIMPLFFAFLGAITFAHSFIISKMFAAGK